MKLHSLFCSIFSFASAISVASAGSFTIEPGYSFVRTSGVRPYAAKQNISQNLTDHVDAPTLRVAFRPSDTWSFGAAYMDYTHLLGRGISPNGDIYNEGTPSVQVMVPVESSERVREIAFDARYRYKFSDQLRLEVGPVLSWFKSRAEIWPVYPTTTFVAGSHVPGRMYSASELKIGGLAGVHWMFSPSWSISGSYRYAAPTDHTFHIFTGSVCYAF